MRRDLSINTRRSFPRSRQTSHHILTNFENLCTVFRRVISRTSFINLEPKKTDNISRKWTASLLPPTAVLLLHRPRSQLSSRQTRRPSRMHLSHHGPFSPKILVHPRASSQKMAHRNMTMTPIRFDMTQTFLLSPDSLFPKLPLLARELVWNFFSTCTCCRYRLRQGDGKIPLFWGRGSCNITCCRESRHIGLRVYTICFGTETHAPAIPFDLEDDCLLFGDWLATSNPLNVQKSVQFDSVCSASSFEQHNFPTLLCVCPSSHCT